VASVTVILVAIGLTGLKPLSAIADDVPAVPIRQVLPEYSETFGPESTDSNGNRIEDIEIQEMAQHLYSLGPCGGPEECKRRREAIRGTGDRGARYLITQYEVGNFTKQTVFSLIAYTGSETGNAWLLEKAHLDVPWRESARATETVRALYARRWAIIALGWVNDRSVIEQELIPMLDSPDLIEAEKISVVNSLRRQVVQMDLDSRDRAIAVSALVDFGERTSSKRLRAASHGALRSAGHAGFSDVTGTPFSYKPEQLEEIRRKAKERNAAQTQE
jgi:hypothetical protein